MIKYPYGIFNISVDKKGLVFYQYNPFWHTCKINFTPVFVTDVSYTTHIKLHSVSNIVNIK